MSINPGQPPSDAARSAGTVVVYWRPGCPYCMGLRRTLKRRGVDANWHNIWEDDDARSFVAHANGGNETVPTVQVCGTTLTNPRWSELSQLLAEVPGSDVEPVEPKPRWLVVLSWLPVVLALTVSFGFDAADQTALSWTMIAVAVAAYFATRPLRR